MHRIPYKVCPRAGAASQYRVIAHVCAQATPERRLQLLVTTAEVVEAVAPGSDAHVTAAVKVWGGGRCGLCVGVVGRVVASCGV